MAILYHTSLCRDIYIYTFPGKYIMQTADSMLPMARQRETTDQAPIAKKKHIMQTADSMFLMARQRETTDHAPITKKKLQLRNLCLKFTKRRAPIFILQWGSCWPVGTNSYSFYKVMYVTSPLYHLLDELMHVAPSNISQLRIPFHVTPSNISQVRIPFHLTPSNIPSF